MATNQKRTVVVVLFIIIVVVLAWQLLGLLKGSSKPTAPKVAMPSLSASMMTPASAPAVKPAPTASSQFNPVADLQTPEQQRYLQMLGEYQLLQIEQRIEEAKLAIATSAANMRKLAAPPVMNENPVIQQPSAPVSDGFQKVVMPPSLRYVGQVNGQWSAIINVGGNFEQVTVGSQLSSGAIVKKITPNTVVLDDHGNPITLTL